jgi:hypothetical protein
MDNTFNYMMLSRLQMDCEYFLGNGARNPKVLHQLDTKKQIQEMVRLYNILPVKPKWISMDDIMLYKDKLK